VAGESTLCALSGDVVDVEDAGSICWDEPVLDPDRERTVLVIACVRGGVGLLLGRGAAMGSKTCDALKVRLRVPRAAGAPVAWTVQPCCRGAPASEASVGARGSASPVT
jgi:hypothetical protein